MGLRKEVFSGEINLRSTEQRHLIQEVLQQADGHLDADEIYQKARQKSPSVSLSTAYRNLSFFRKLGLVEQHLLDSRYFYEIATRARHHHLICLGCGRVFEFKCPFTEHLKSRIKKEEGFKVTEADVRLAGYCPECQRRLSVNTS